MSWYKKSQNNEIKVVLVHGWMGSPNDDFFPWLIKEVESEGYKVIAPSLPDTNTPEIKPWINKLKEVVGEADKNTYFIGHSLGVPAILRYLASLSKGTEIGGAIFVAPFVISSPVETWEDYKEGDQEIVDTWLGASFDLNKVNGMADNFVAILSDNDPYVPVQENTDLLKKGLNAKIIIEEDKGHYTPSDGVKKVPIVLDELLKMIK